VVELVETTCLERNLKILLTFPLSQFGKFYHPIPSENFLKTFDAITIQQVKAALSFCLAAFSGLLNKSC
jgi:hypothetical protein